MPLFQVSIVKFIRYLADFMIFLLFLIVLIQKQTYMKALLLLLILSVTFVINSQAQVQRCGTTEYQEALDLVYPELKTQRMAFNNQSDQLTSENSLNRTSLIVTIPVVFHILYTSAAQNISDARLFEQLDVMNKDFSRSNLDASNTRSMFQGVAANTQIQFCLAQQTPTGIATTGIVRVSYTGNFPSNPHSISPEWNHNNYLNIYIGALGGLLGYSNLPPGSAGNDHVVAEYTAVGGPNVPGTFVPYHLGRTITHEVGHWLNLQHTFNGGCAGTTANNCSMAGDFVCDTPPTANAAFGCPTNSPNSCTETPPYPPPYTSNMVDMFENYMDYTDDGCMNMFSMGQSTRMNAAITNLRSQLLTSLGCVPVGIHELLDENFVSVAPNPSAGEFLINYRLPSKTDVTLTVCDVMGKIILTEKLSYPIKSQSTLDLSEKSNGVYQLRVETANGYLVKRLVINK